ncbi:MAG: HAMP domain-containing sensor histidine kinase [Candidatus Omnitrophota bacterium]
MRKSLWKEKRIEIYLTAVIIPSILLGVLALWALTRQYNLIKRLSSGYALSSLEGNWLNSFSQVSAFALSMLIFALFLILLIGSYLSAQDMQRQLEVVRLKSDFVSTVSHELKTPITSIRLLTERLINLPPDEIAKQKEYYSVILTQSYRLSHLINNVLDFTKLDEGKQSYKLEKADLTNLVSQSIQDYPVKLIKPGCKLEIKLADDLPLFYLDKEAISRAFINILDNALKFSPSTGIIKINVYKLNEEAFIEIADQGQGIEKKEKEKIFERFYHMGKGTGLGLKIARCIIEGHNGRIELESQLYKGSKFKIILPLKNKV